MSRKLATAALTVLIAAVGASSAQAAVDGNHDGLPDRWEKAHHLSLHKKQAKLDPDRDGLSNKGEYVEHTDPHSADTDGDGVKDGVDGAPTNAARIEAPSGSTPAEHAPATGGAEPGATGFGGHVAHYAQGSGFGGVLKIHNDRTIEDVTAFFGEKTDLECATEHLGPYAPCDKSNLKDGTPVTHAEHAVNAYGADVWTHVYLVVPTVSTRPPDPAPATPAGYGSVFSFEAGALTLVRDNNGEHVTAAAGAWTDLECGTSLSGPFTKCSPDALKPGRKVAQAVHGVADGQDRWSKVYLVVTP
jgi:hypothetical protein